MKKISIIIPTHNRKNYLNNILNQILSQRLDFFSIYGYEVVIIVIIDGSIDGTIEMIDSSFPEIIKILGNGDWWYTKSINEGIIKAIKIFSEYVLLLNDDVEIHKNYLINLFKAVKGTKSDAIIGSLSLTYEPPHRIYFSGVKKINWWTYKTVRYDRVYTVYNPQIHKGLRTSIKLTGRGLLIPTKIFQLIGYFDEKFPQYGSDEEFCLCARKHGFDILIDCDSIIYSHLEQTGKGSLLLKQNLKSLTHSFFNKYSPNYLMNNLRIQWRYGKVIVIPFTFLRVIFAYFINYFKRSFTKTI